MTHRQTIPMMLLALAAAAMTVSPVAAQAPAAQRVVLPTDRTVLPVPEPVNPPITELDARKTMQDKVMRALPPKKAIRYFQLESKIRAMQDYDIAKGIPLVK